MEEKSNLVEKLAGVFGQNATVRNVYGDPIETKEKTIIPVAQIKYGFGGGQGQSKKNRGDEEGRTEDDANEKGKGGEGSGGGGGLMAKPKGVYEITNEGTRFIPTNNMQQLLLAGLAGFVIHRLFFRRRKK